MLTCSGCKVVHYCSKVCMCNRYTRIHVVCASLERDTFFLYICARDSRSTNCVQGQEQKPNLVQGQVPTLAVDRGICAHTHTLSLSDCLSHSRALSLSLPRSFFFNSLFLPLISVLLMSLFFPPLFLFPFLSVFLSRPRQLAPKWGPPSPACISA